MKERSTSRPICDGASDFWDSTNRGQFDDDVTFVVAAMTA
jgi:hypothetical protein